MAPPDPPRSIYGTLPRSTGGLGHAVSENSLPAHYATFRRERLGPKVSLKLKQMMKTDKDEAQDTMSIMSGFTDPGSGTRGSNRHLAEVFYQRVRGAAPAQVTKDSSDIMAADSLETDVALKDNQDLHLVLFYARCMFPHKP